MAHRGTSIVPDFDDQVHYTSILTKGDEPEFMKFVRNQVDCSKKWLTAELEKIQYREQITKLTAEKDGLETKLLHARSQVDTEMRRRMKAEQKQDELESQVNLIRELLTDKGTLSEKERESLAFLDRTTPTNMDGTPTRRLSAIHESSGNLLDPSDISYDHTEDDLDVSYLRDGKKWKGKTKRRPSAPPLEDDTPPKRSKLDASIVTTTTTTTVTLPASGHIVSEARIETTPNVNTRSRKKSTRSHGGNLNGVDIEDDSFWSNPENQSLKNALYTAPTHSSPPVNRPSHYQQQQQKIHEFQTKTVIRPETCGPCGKKVKFGKYALKCRSCRAVCHPDCKEGVALPCVPVAGTPNKQLPNKLEEFVPSTSPQVPHLVVQCVQEIEARGMSEEGLYRLSGSEKQMKELKERMVMGKDAKLDKINDIHIVCGVLKDFLRKIEEPIITFALHDNFMNAAGISNIDDSITAMYQVISELPSANRDTLAYVVLHLQRVAESKPCKMPKTNLAKVFGPTIVRHGCPDPEPMQMLNDTKLQPAVVDRLLSMPTDFWRAFINVDCENQENMMVDGHSPARNTPGKMSTAGYSTPTLTRIGSRNVPYMPETSNDYIIYNTKASAVRKKRSFRGKSKNAHTSMLGPLHTPGSSNKMGKKTPSSTSVSGKSKSIFNKTPLTPRFGSRGESRSSKKTTTFFSSPTLR